MESTGEDAVNIVEMTKMDSECYIYLVDKAVGFERIDSNFGRNSVLSRKLSAASFFS
jgi:hypothetical protein